MVSKIVSLLRRNGHIVETFFRDSATVRGSIAGKISAFAHGFHGGAAVREFTDLLDRFEPDIVQVQNVYPLISPVVCKIAAQKGIPVVLRCANYRLICPTGLHISHGRQCEACVGGREYQCVLRNCENDLAKSVAYAARNWWARQTGAFSRHVSLYVAQTDFQRSRLIRGGVPGDRLVVIPNMAEVDHTSKPGAGESVLYVGRVSHEKGVDVLVAAARLCPTVPFIIAGECPAGSELRAVAPPNVTFLGHVPRQKLGELYLQSRIVVVPSICFEGFPSVIIEAMLHRRPVISSRIGGLPEIVREGVTGLLFKPGAEAELAQKIAYLWTRHEECSRLGTAAYDLACREYSPDAYYDRLIRAYGLAAATEAPAANA